MEFFFLLESWSQRTSVSQKLVWTCTFESLKASSKNWVLKIDGRQQTHTEGERDAIQCVWYMFREFERIWVRAWSRFCMAVCNSSSKLISLSLISSQRSVRSAASASLNPSWNGKRETTRNKMMGWERKWTINKWGSNACDTGQIFKKEQMQGRH